MKKLRAIFCSILSFKKLDSFRLGQAENSTQI
jgi:hypothetical protein